MIDQVCSYYHHLFEYEPFEKNILLVLIKTYKQPTHAIMHIAVVDHGTFQALVSRNITSHMAPEYRCEKVVHITGLSHNNTNDTTINSTFTFTFAHLLAEAAC